MFKRRGEGDTRRPRATQAAVGLTTYIITIYGLPPIQALYFSHRGDRETGVTSDEAQGTMGRRCERWSRFLLPAFLCAHQPRPQVLSLPAVTVIWASPFPKTLVICASLVTLTQIAKVISEGDAHHTRVLGRGMPITLWPRPSPFLGKKALGRGWRAMHVNQKCGISPFDIP